MRILFVACLDSTVIGAFLEAKRVVSGGVRAVLERHGQCANTVQRAD